METYLRLTINLIAMMVSVIIFVSSRSRSDRAFSDYMLFTLLITVTMGILVLDTITWSVDGQAGGLARFVNVLGNLLYYLANLAVPLLYTFYVLAQIRGRTRRPLLRLIFLAGPAALGGILCLVNLGTGSFFYFDAANTYHRGPLFPLFAALMFGYTVFATGCIVFRRTALDRRSVISFLLVPLAPVCLGVIQALLYGINVMWPAVVVSLLLIYINVQQRRLSIDYLSGTFNRRRLDEYLEERVEDARDRGIGFAGFLADMDDFKRINDELGHKVGDRAIIETSRIMRSGLRARDFLARYAGDEFVAVLTACGRKELDMVVARVRSRLAREGAWTGSCPPVEVSIGAAIFDKEQDKNGDAFVKRLDKLMYAEKIAKKRARRIAGHK